MRRCPDLFWDDALGCYRCAMADDPEWGPFVRRGQDMDGTCCAPLNPYRDDVKNRDDE